MLFLGGGTITLIWIKLLEICLWINFSGVVSFELCQNSSVFLEGTVLARMWGGNSECVVKKNTKLRRDVTRLGFIIKATDHVQYGEKPKNIPRQD